MNIFRTILLWCSHNKWLHRHIPKWRFTRAAVRRFIPGEQLDDAAQAAKSFQERRIAATFTKLGENIVNLGEAAAVTNHYINVLEQIVAENLNAEISLKLTQIGLDLSVEQTHDNFRKIAGKAKETGSYVWIDMEGSDYTDLTLDFYKQQRREFANIGICLQAYLRRTQNDLAEMLRISPAIRLVKGAYKEPAEIAFAKKQDADKNYYDLAIKLLGEIKQNKIRVAFATHDIDLLNRIEGEGERLGLARSQLEFQMLYGIKTGEQFRLAEQGYKIRVLISYGEAWFAWYIRRLAERPANVWFVLKNLFVR